MKRQERQERDRQKRCREGLTAMSAISSALTAGVVEATPQFVPHMTRLGGGTCFTCSASSDPITTRNEMPFSVKHDTIPKRCSAMPASSGPRTRAMLNWMEFNAIAFGRSSVLTRDGMSD